MAKSKANETTELAIPSLGAAGAIVASEAAGAFRAEAGQIIATPKTLPMIRINHKAATWTMPSGEEVDSVDGFPLHYAETRRFFAGKWTVGASNPPDCWSADGIRPSPTSPKRQAEACYQCPMAAFGSAEDGKSQRCGSRIMLFIVNPAFGNPPLAFLEIPASSFKVLLGNRRGGGYLSKAKAAAEDYQLAWTRWGLEPSGGAHSLLTAELLSVCRDPEQTRTLGKLYKECMAAMEASRGRTGDAPGAADDGGGREPGDEG